MENGRRRREIVFDENETSEPYLTYISGDTCDFRCEDVVRRGWIVQRRAPSASLLWRWRFVSVSFPEDRLDAWSRRPRTVAAISQIILRRIAAPAHLGQTLDVQILRGFQQGRQSRLKHQQHHEFNFNPVETKQRRIFLLSRESSFLFRRLIHSRIAKSVFFLAFFFFYIIYLR